VCAFVVPVEPPRAHRRIILTVTLLDWICPRSALRGAGSFRLNRRENPSMDFSNILPVGTLGSAASCCESNYLTLRSSIFLPTPLALVEKAKVTLIIPPLQLYLWQGHIYNKPLASHHHQRI
jgi:hypothetical protein